MKPDMFCGKSLFSHIVKAVIIAFLVFSINPLEAARLNMKSKLGTTQDRAQVPPSAPNPPTYMPGPGNGGGHK